MTYTGPTSLSGVTNLTASTTLPNVVGVTWLLDGKPVGTSSVAPYTFDANTALLPGGSHTMTVQTVDQDGNRSTSPGVPVTVGDGPASSASVVHLTGTQGALTLAAGELAYGDGSTSVINGNVTMASNSRLEDVVVNGTINGTTTTGARVQDVTINPPASATQALQLGASTGFDLEDSTIACGQAAGNIKGVYNGNSDTGSNNVVFARDTITNCGGDGIWLVASAADITTAIAHVLVLDNAISGANGSVDNGTQARGILVGGYEGNVIGNTVTGGSTASIEPFRSAQSMHFARNTVSGSPTGFYLEHYSDNSVFENNTVESTGHGFNVEWVASSSPPRSTIDAHIIDNQITAPVAVFADAGSSGIETGGNTITTSTLPTIVYEGSVLGSVHDNVICTAATGSPVSIYANDGYDPTAPATLTTQTNNVLDTSC